MLTRRQCLLAGGGLIVAAGTGAALGTETPQGRRVLRRLGVISSPDLTVPVARGITFQDGELASRFVPSPPGWRIAIPPAQLGPPVGIVYCLHGRGDDQRFVFDDVRLPDFVVASGTPLVVAAVDGGPDSYWHERADGSDAMKMLLQEFMPMVEQRTGRLDASLLGWSMGGYGALLAAETAPERFTAVLAVSPALWTSPGDSAPGAFDDANDYRRHDVFPGRDRLKEVMVRVDCGEDDPFLGASKRFVGGLTSPHTSSFGPGGHDVGYWRSVAPAQLVTIAEALAGRPN
ncbi:MAG TPA: alpha/beta hydrolase-fold protein [Acidimicrobiales bacterium]|nr:alpha/beta hydrolase-fold protein [Acidimicrobiales bacterium]